MKFSPSSVMFNVNGQMLLFNFFFCHSCEGPSSQNQHFKLNSVIAVSESQMVAKLIQCIYKHKLNWGTKLWQ